MKIIKSLNVSNDSSIEIIEISKDKRFCAVLSNNNEIYFIKDAGVSSNELLENIAKMGFKI